MKAKQGTKKSEMKNIRYVKPEKQLEAVKQNAYAIEYIHNPSEKVQLQAVKQNGDAIRYIHNPSEKVQLRAVKQNRYAILFNRNPSEKVQLQAVKQNRYAIQWIREPCPSLQMTAIEFGLEMGLNKTRQFYSCWRLTKESQKTLRNLLTIKDVIE